MSTHLEIERKWLVKDIDRQKLRLDYKDVCLITRVYLKSSDPKLTVRISHRHYPNDNRKDQYILTEKKLIDKGIHEETETTVPFKEFQMLTQVVVDPKRVPIVKIRTIIPCLDKYKFELDEFIHPTGLILLELEVESTKELTKLVTIPYFIVIDKEVTGDKRYSNHNLAKR